MTFFFLFFFILVYLIAMDCPFRHGDEINRRRWESIATDSSIRSGAYEDSLTSPTSLFIIL